MGRIPPAPRAGLQGRMGNARRRRAPVRASVAWLSLQSRGSRWLGPPPLMPLHRRSPSTAAHGSCARSLCRPRPVGSAYLRLPSAV
eukprot:11531300-Alexandrium_andersonii.AAC.1